MLSLLICIVLLTVANGISIPFIIKNSLEIDKLKSHDKNHNKKTTFEKPEKSKIMRENVINDEDEYPIKSNYRHTALKTSKVSFI